MNAYVKKKQIFCYTKFGLKGHSRPYKVIFMFINRSINHYKCMPIFCSVYKIVIVNFF